MLPLLVASSLAASASPEALSHHAETLRTELGEDFTVIVEPPFVVVGDARPSHVRIAVARFEPSRPSRAVSSHEGRGGSFRAGLGALFDDSGTRASAVIGLPNERVLGVQEDIASGELDTLTTLMARTDLDFFLDRPNALHARYLMLYLQEHDLLWPFYHRYRSAMSVDPTGVSVLKALSSPASRIRRWRGLGLSALG